MSGSASASSRWRDIIDEFRHSGLTQAEFCQQRGLSLGTFRKYLYGSRPIAKTAPVVEFLPVTSQTPPIEDPQPTTDLLVLILAGGQRVAVAPGFDSRTLKRIVETIEGLA
jgi:hypothetical protein